MSTTAEIHRQMFDAVQNRDFDTLRSLYHPGYTYMSGDGVEQPGADAGVAVAETYTTAFPDLSFEIRNQYTSGDSTSIIEFTARGTHTADLPDLPATGRSGEMVVCNIIETLDGKIHREREYYDNMALLTQLGAVPAAVAAGT